MSEPYVGSPDDLRGLITLWKKMGYQFDKDKTAKLVGMYNANPEKIRDLYERFQYAHDVYGIQKLSTAQKHMPTIQEQCQFNHNRMKNGLQPLYIYDIRWNPSAYDDDTNEALGLWYNQNKSLPQSTQSPEFNSFLTQYKQNKNARNLRDAYRLAGHAPVDTPQPATGGVRNWAMLEHEADAAVTGTPAAPGSTMLAGMPAIPPPEYGKGNVDLNNRPLIQDGETGAYETLRPIIYRFEDNGIGQYLVLPSVIRGENGAWQVERDTDKVLQYYMRNREHLGKFGSEEEARGYIDSLYESQQQKYGHYLPPAPTPAGSTPDNPIFHIKPGEPVDFESNRLPLLYTYGDLLTQTFHNAVYTEGNDYYASIRDLLDQGYKIWEINPYNGNLAYKEPDEILTTEDIQGMLFLWAKELNLPANLFPRDEETLKYTFIAGIPLNDSPEVQDAIAKGMASEDNAMLSHRAYGKTMDQILKEEQQRRSRIHSSPALGVLPVIDPDPTDVAMLALTQQEKDKINFYYGLGDKKTADHLFRYLTNAHAVEYSQGMGEAVKQTLTTQTTDDFWTRAGKKALGGLSAVLSTIPQSLYAIDVLYNSVGNLFTGETLAAPETHNALQMRMLQGAEQSIAQGMGAVPKFFTDLGVGTAKMLPILATGQVAAPIIMGMSAAGSAALDAKDRGANGLQQLLTAVTHGVAEGLFEKWSLGRLQAFKPIGELSAKEFASTLLKNGKWAAYLKELGKLGFVNATEEVSTDLSNMLADHIIMDMMGNGASQSEIIENYENRVKNGEKSPAWGVFWDVMGQLAYTGGQGFGMGLTLGGGKIAGQAVGATYTASIGNNQTGLPESSAMNKSDDRSATGHLADMTYPVSSELKAEASKFYHKAQSAQGDLNSLLKQINNELALDGWVGSQKSRKSIIDKVVRKRHENQNYTAANCKDHARGALFVHDYAAIPAIERKLHERGLQYKAENFFEKPTSWGYVGYHITYRTPNGVGVEIQIASRDVWEVKKQSDQIYDKWRNCYDIDQLDDETLRNYIKDRQRSRVMWSSIRSGILPSLQNAAASSSEKTNPSASSDTESDRANGPHAPLVNSNGFLPSAMGDMSSNLPVSVNTKSDMISTPFNNSIRLEREIINTEKSNDGFRGPAILQHDAKSLRAVKESVRAYMDSLTQFAALFHKSATLAKEITDIKGTPASSYADPALTGYVFTEDAIQTTTGTAPHIAIAAHEFLSTLENTPEYESLRDAAYAGTPQDRLAAETDRLGRLYGGNTAAIERQIVADWVGKNLFTNERAIRSFAAKNPAVERKMMEFIDGVNARIEKAGGMQAIAGEMEEAGRKWGRELKNALDSGSKSEFETQKRHRQIEHINTHSGRKGVITDALQITQEQMANKPKHSPVPETWFNKGGTITIDKDGVWTYHDWEGNSVRYLNGFPNFRSSGLVIQEVMLDRFESRNLDSAKADRIAKERRTPRLETSSWHHHEDMKTLQEIDQNIHNRFKHKGGISLFKCRGE